MKRAELKQSAFAVGFSILIVALLLVMSPAQAIQLSANVPASGSTNNQVTMQAYLNIETGENVPLQRVHVRIEGPSPTFCVFELDGTPVEGCEKLKVLSYESSAPYTPGNLSAEGWNGKKELATNFGFGYGYGPKKEVKREFVWRLVWDTTSSKAGEYKVTYWVVAQNNQIERKYAMKEAAKIKLQGKDNVCTGDVAKLPVKCEGAKVASDKILANGCRQVVCESRESRAVAVACDVQNDTKYEVSLVSATNKNTKVCFGEACVKKEDTSESSKYECKEKKDEKHEKDD